MAISKLAAEKRDAASEKGRKLRREGFVPAVLYGHRDETQNIKISHSELRNLVAHHGSMEQSAVVRANLFLDMPAPPIGSQAIGAFVLPVECDIVRTTEANDEIAAPRVLTEATGLGVGDEFQPELGTGRAQGFHVPDLGLDGCKMTHMRVLLSVGVRSWGWGERESPPAPRSPEKARRTRTGRASMCAGPP